MPMAPEVLQNCDIDSQTAGKSDALLKHGEYDSVHYEIISNAVGDSLRLRVKSDSSVYVATGRLVAGSSNVRLQKKMKKSIRSLLGPDESSYQILSVRSEHDDKENGKTGGMKTGDEASKASYAGWALLAPACYGEITGLKLNDETMCIADGAMIASIGDVESEVKSQGLKNALFSGNGMFLKVVKGSGIVFVGAVGAISSLKIEKDEEIVVDPGYLLAWPASLTLNVRRTGDGMLSNLPSSAALCAIKGPAVVHLQSRKADKFAEWVYDTRAPPARGPLGVPKLTG